MRVSRKKLSGQALRYSSINQFTEDRLHALASPSVGACTLAAAWIALSLVFDGYSYGKTRGSTAAALQLAALVGASALGLVLVELGALEWVQQGRFFVWTNDLGFAAGMLPVLGAWRYVLAENTPSP